MSSNSLSRASGGLEHLLAAARGGSMAALGTLLERCRHYLLLIAHEDLESDLQAKAGASDLVQDTFLEAQEAFAGFEGDSEQQLLAWLRQILRHNLIDFRDRYRHAERRQVSREVTLETAEHLNVALRAGTLSPRSQAIQREDAEALRNALESFPESYRQVIELRHREHLPFTQIGRRMDRSADAARMLWCRAVERLAEELNPEANTEVVPLRRQPS